MPSSSSRSRVPVRRSPRPAPRPVPVPSSAGERPIAVPVATVFGVLVAGENAYLARLMWTPEVGWDWFMTGPLLLAVLALAGAAAVFLGRRLGWVPLAVSAALSLLVVLALAVLFALLGGGQAMWAAVLLLVGPLGALILSLRRPVRDWTARGRARRPPGGRRTAGSAR
jgi:peptidoglycan/LPS O-acetylase OafA/YrhL